MDPSFAKVSYYGSSMCMETYALTSGGKRVMKLNNFFADGGAVHRRR